jgi:LuxR family maltose regulon positive regulatory protein
LPRLRARGQVTEVRERDLRFTMEEAAAFLNRTMSLSLSAQSVEALEVRTEGWIAGLQLAASALQEKQEDTETFVAAFTGDVRYVTDYLVAEVFQQQPEATRDFLRQTAILDRLAAPLCDAVRGRDDSRSMLDGLERANVFLTPLDQRREWYRYDYLFAEFLRARLDPEEREVLHRRAARWYEENGFIGQAIGHALAYSSAAGGATEDAERLIRLGAAEVIHRGGMLTVRGWLDALPDERVRADGELAAYKGWVLALSGELDQAETYADAAETCIDQVEAAAAARAKLLLLRAFIAMGRRDYEGTMALAAGALQGLGEDQPRWRLLALWAMAESQERTRNITEAIATLREATWTGRALGNQVFAAAVEVFLASALHSHGRRREAVTVCEEAVERYTEAAGRVSPVAGPVLSWLGRLRYEANQLESARECVERGLTLCEQLALEDFLTLSYGVLALILRARGEVSAAVGVLHKAHQLAGQQALADASWLLAWEADIRLEQGDLASTLRWAEAAGLSLDVPPHYLRMEQHLVYGRLLMAQGRLADARRWLARVGRFAQERGRYRTGRREGGERPAGPGAPLPGGGDRRPRGLLPCLPRRGWARDRDAPRGP